MRVDRVPARHTMSVAARRQAFGTLIFKSFNRFAASTGNLSLTYPPKSLGCCRLAASFWYLDFQVFKSLTEDRIIRRCLRPSLLAWISMDALYPNARRCLLPL